MKNLTSVLPILNSNVSALAERIKSLAYSVKKNNAILPITLENLGVISEEQKESIDAMILRYSQCVAMLQDQIFRGIALAEQEDLTNKSNRDKTLLMEKLGVIKSADHFGYAAVLRNKFAHAYPEDSQDQLDKLNLLTDESRFVIEAFGLVVVYMTEKGLLGDNSSV